MLLDRITSQCPLYPFLNASSHNSAPRHRHLSNISIQRSPSTSWKQVLFLVRQILLYHPPNLPIRIEMLADGPLFI